MNSKSTKTQVIKCLRWRRWDKIRDIACGSPYPMYPSTITILYKQHNTQYISLSSIYTVPSCRLLNATQSFLYTKRCLLLSFCTFKPIFITCHLWIFLPINTIDFFNACTKIHFQVYSQLINYIGMWLQVRACGDLSCSLFAFVLPTKFHLNLAYHYFRHNQYHMYGEYI